MLHKYSSPSCLSAGCSISHKTKWDTCFENNTNIPLIHHALVCCYCHHYCEVPAIESMSASYYCTGHQFPPKATICWWRCSSFPLLVQHNACQVNLYLIQLIWGRLHLVGADNVPVIERRLIHCQCQTPLVCQPYPPRGSRYCYVMITWDSFSLDFFFSSDESEGSNTRHVSHVLSTYRCFVTAASLLSWFSAAVNLLNDSLGGCSCFTVLNEEVFWE